jgi:hypothetical protein
MCASTAAQGRSRNTPPLIFCTAVRYLQPSTGAHCSQDMWQQERGGQQQELNPSQRCSKPSTCLPYARPPCNFPNTPASRCRHAQPHTHIRQTRTC